MSFSFARSSESRKVRRAPCHSTIGLDARAGCCTGQAKHRDRPAARRSNRRSSCGTRAVELVEHGATRAMPRSRPASSTTSRVRLDEPVKQRKQHHTGDGHAIAEGHLVSHHQHELPVVRLYLDHDATLLQPHAVEPLVSLNERRGHGHGRWQAPDHLHRHARQPPASLQDCCASGSTSFSASSPSGLPSLRQR